MSVPVPARLTGDTAPAAGEQSSRDWGWCRTEDRDRRERGPQPERGVLERH